MGQQQQLLNLPTHLSMMNCVYLLVSASRASERLHGNRDNVLIKPWETRPFSAQSSSQTQTPLPCRHGQHVAGLRGSLPEHPPPPLPPGNTRALTPDLAPDLVETPRVRIYTRGEFKTGFCARLFLFLARHRGNGRKIDHKAVKTNGRLNFQII